MKIDLKKVLPSELSSYVGYRIVRITPFFKYITIPFLRIYRSLTHPCH